MKLAEALLLRADIVKKVAGVQERLSRNCVHIEGRKPEEDPVKLLEENFLVIDKLEQVISKINHANTVNTLPDGMTITQAMARRDTYIKRHSVLTTVINSCRNVGVQDNMYDDKKIVRVSPFTVKDIRKQADDLSAKIREINARIQETNWKVEIEI